MQSGDLIAGRYELAKRLGRGGMGEVWAARDRRLHRDVALKLLALGDDVPPELAKRFDREAVAAAQINHPNVASLYDRGRHEDLLFLVMEKVDGSPLNEHLQAHPVLAPPDVLAIAEDICAALVAAHAAGVVHYDIKPHNVMLTPDRQVKVVDFGIAGFLQTAFTLAHSSQLTPAGTPEYGAPEQFLAERGDTRSDLYALGGLLFALLTGRAAFTGPNAMAVVRRKLDEDAPRLDTLRPDLPAALVDLVAALLARDPARRPQTATKVLRLLRELKAAPATVPTPAWAPTVLDGAPPEGVIQLGWRGDEPLKSYANLQRLWSFVLIFSMVAAVAAAMFFVYQILPPNPGDSYPTSGLARAVFAIGLVTGFVAVLLLLIMPILVFRQAKDAHARRPSSPWSLHVGPEGITVTSEAGSDIFTWPTITRVAIESIQGPSIHKITGIILDLGPAAPPHALLRPAGWPYMAGFLRMDPRTRVPVCVLGPATERQRKQLIQFLTTHAGPAWAPETFFTTRPTDGR
jgi:predicted Ser/Thr protein kinase